MFLRGWLLLPFLQHPARSTTQTQSPVANALNNCRTHVHKHDAGVRHTWRWTSWTCSDARLRMSTPVRGRARRLLGLLLCDDMGRRGCPVGLRQRPKCGAPRTGEAVEGAPPLRGLRARNRRCFPALRALLLLQRGRALLWLCGRVCLCCIVLCTRAAVPASKVACQHRVQSSCAGLERGGHGLLLHPHRNYFRMQPRSTEARRGGCLIATLQDSSTIAAP